jgi:hypothetical protein
MVGVGDYDGGRLVVTGCTVTISHSTARSSVPGRASGDPHRPAKQVRDTSSTHTLIQFKHSEPGINFI